jgi:hypothetical protein
MHLYLLEVITRGNLLPAREVLVEVAKGAWSASPSQGVLVAGGRVPVVFVSVCGW